MRLQAYTLIMTIANEKVSDSLLTGHSLSNTSGTDHCTACLFLMDPADLKSGMMVERPKLVKCM